MLDPALKYIFPLVISIFNLQLSCTHPLLSHNLTKHREMIAGLTCEKAEDKETIADLYCERAEDKELIAGLICERTEDKEIFAGLILRKLRAKK